MSEKTLIGGFSCVNIKLAFDTEILLDNNKNEKVVFDLYIDGKKTNKNNFYQDTDGQPVWTGND